MKKSSKTNPKELLKKRIARNKIMKIPNNEGKFSNKENEHPQQLIKHNTSYKKHDREIKDENLPNPFDIPDHTRLFTKSKGKRKVKQEPFIMSEPHTICDIDHSFYKIIDGRPVRQFIDFKAYMREIRDITLSKANTGYLNDQIIRFQSTHEFEVEQYNQIYDLYKITKMNFQRFAKQSYNKAKEAQLAAEIKALELAKKTDELGALSFEYVKTRNQVYRIMFSFQTLSNYGNFLNSMAPAWWQKEFGYLFTEKNMQLNASVWQSDIGAATEASLNEYKFNLEELQKVPPRLYFKRPKEIIHIFEDLSEQSLNYMKIDCVNAKILKSVLKSREFFKSMAKAETNEMEDFIEIYENNLKAMEQKEMNYKAMFEKLLYSKFRKLYASPISVKLFTCVQYVYMIIFGGFEDPQEQVIVMMQALEREFLEISSNMDKLDFEIVKKATSHMYAEDLKMMKRAYLAQRNLKEYATLSEALYTSFEPPRQRKLHQKTTRSSVKLIHKLN